MLRAIRWMGLTGLVAMALAAWIAYAHMIPVSAEGDIMSYLPPFVFTTGNVLSFAAGVLTLALTISRRQRPWSIALLASLILNAYWFNAFYTVLRMFNPPDGVLLSSSLSVVVIDVISSGLVPPLLPRCWHSATASAPPALFPRQYPPQRSRGASTLPSSRWGVRRASRSRGCLHVCLRLPQPP